MAPSKSAYPHEVQEGLRHMLRDLPEPTPDDVTKKTMIRSLAPEIQQLQQRGYSLKAIAEAMSKHGVPISPLVLKAYLTADSKPKKPKRRRAPSTATPNAAAEADATKPSSATTQAAPATAQAADTPIAATGMVATDTGDDDWAEEARTPQPISASPAEINAPKVQGPHAGRPVSNRKST